ncbi:dihydropteroate synthase [Chondrinema litorale]|uniref:dihydropteroate synthase n=1 Tax=Chondrinema litorale TaxID=2994555 RepID=UPI00254299D8|nr:dihydropteroate synthase [Chondrinema litorale]UZR95853.1 dihydropteroate synthase [Chondrinema litorale]
MGILNITPDSFFDGGKWVGDIAQTIGHAGKMLKDGATIIDVGGYSSRPNAENVSPQEEIDRVVPVIEALVAQYPDIIISIDTFRGSVAQKAVEVGAAIINDISGGNIDKEMLQTVAALKVPYILMHMQGTPQNMQTYTQYDNIILEMLAYFREKIDFLTKAGCTDIILDPGFGFSKNLEQNYFLLSHLDQFNILNLPILVGVSRKSMIYKKLGITPAEALNGTTAINTLALKNGASILRVHDVREANQIIRLLYD